MYMYNDETFKMQHGERTFEIQRSSVYFQNGYAVVKKGVERYDQHNFHVTLRGVIDRKYNTILDFKKSYSEIEIFPEGNIWVVEDFYRGEGDQAHIKRKNYHYKINGKEISKINEFSGWKYEQINDTTIKLGNSVMRESFEALYDVVKG